MTLSGCILVRVGVIFAILGCKTEDPRGLDSTPGQIRYGAMMEIIAALGQDSGAIIDRPVIATGIDPVMASAVRVGVAEVALLFLGLFPHPIIKPQSQYTPQLLGWILISDFIAIGLSMTLLLFTLSHSEAGVVATLSATTPVLILTLL